MKIFLLKLTVISLLITVTLASLNSSKKKGCPEPIDTRPCTCYNSPKTVLECQHIEESEILRNVFRNSSGYEYKEVHIKYSVLQYLPYDIFEKVHVYALYLKNVTLIQLFDKPPTFLQDVDTLHIESTKLLRGVIWKLLEPLTHLRVLNIYYNNIKSLGSDFSEHATKELQQLSFYETGTKTIKPGTFRDFVNLDKLAIDHCKITTLSRDMFPVPFNARYLYFNYNQLTSIPDNLFTNMPNLQTIGLRSNNIVVLPESAFFGVTKLQFFQLDDNPITCDCRLAWLIRNKPSAVSGKCNMPSKFKGKDIKDIDLLSIFNEELITLRRTILVAISKFRT
ncbi:hypothetical protein TNIN_135131 [Trichonephila inaurata madagascariensis]|uniref:Uncharacterized protein n=1 Tax=Trichonephila inaurata madagascariensis TaxID=2747483 RepID=A0A8X6Y0Y6_9ARAC|nr:hypothetical protein TNIN_135131 [Trichonephila inaurata madagascariensis]